MNTFGFQELLNTPHKIQRLQMNLRLTTFKTSETATGVTTGYVQRLQMDLKETTQRHEKFGDYIQAPETTTSGPYSLATFLSHKNGKQTLGLYPGLGNTIITI